MDRSVHHYENIAHKTLSQLVPNYPTRDKSTMEVVESGSQKGRYFIWADIKFGTTMY